MNYTRTFDDTLQAYRDKAYIIVNRGGTRSGKSFATLQLIEMIARFSSKKLVITIVSHSLPHLEGGVIRDFDNILTALGYDVSSVKTKKPYLYKIGKSLIEFVGFDKPGKALGAARDILFINEANKMPWHIVHQLMQRTKGTTFIDYNPSEKYWIDTEGILERKKTVVIDSTFLDNYKNLTRKQIDELLEAKAKHDEEEASGMHGYWYNYWRVYGLGLQGSTEGKVYTKWVKTTLEKFEAIQSTHKVIGVDFGFTHPAGIVECRYDDGDWHVKELLYKSKVTDYVQVFDDLGIEKDSIVIADNARPEIITSLQMANYFVMPCFKDQRLNQIERMKRENIFYVGDNIENEYDSYSHITDTKTNEITREVPKVKDDLMDAIRYAIIYYSRYYLCNY